MFACLGRLGCLLLVLVGAVVGWLTRDRWQPRVFGDRGSPTVTWQPLGRGDGERASAKVESLSRREGPGYVTLTASELVSLLARQGGYGLPETLDSVFAAVDEDRVRVRGMVPLDQIRGVDALGPLSGLLDKQEPIELSGTLAVVRQGLGEFRVSSVSLADLAIPQAAIPKLLARLDNVPRPEGIAPDGIAITIPDWIGDVRVARGVVTLYRRTP